ncbi:MAG TPA: hypothetical protein P5147_21550, partial [Myxococcota bacterium]|nr:hypothetical protein [Myxococcota bacterium]
TGPDCGGADCAACPDPCADHCASGAQDCGETGPDCGGADCAACPDPCANHCASGAQDCGETGFDCGGECSPCGQGGCTFPQGVPEGAFTGGVGNDAGIAAAVNAVMQTLSGCDIGSDCTLDLGAFPGPDDWFGAVNQALRDQGYCAGRHEEGYTDEIAVSSTGCTGRWYGYHIYNYGGGKVVWNPGAQRGWWSIDPSYCP